MLNRSKPRFAKVLTLPKLCDFTKKAFYANSNLKVRKDSMNLDWIIVGIFFLALGAITEIVFFARYNFSKYCLVGLVVAWSIVFISLLYVYFATVPLRYFGFAGMAYMIYCIRCGIKLEEIYHSWLNGLQFFNYLAVVVLGSNFFYFNNPVEILKPIPLELIRIYGSAICLAHFLVQTIYISFRSCK